MAAAPWQAACREQGVLRDLCADVKLPAKYLDTFSLLVSRHNFLNCASGNVSVFCCFPPLSDNSEKRFLIALLGWFETTSPGAQRAVVDLCKD